MARTNFDFETGPDGATLTTANTGFNTVTINAGTAATFDAAGALLGSFAAKFAAPVSPTASAQVTARHNFTASNLRYVRLYVKFSVIGGVLRRFCQARTAGNAIGQVQMSTAGKFQFADASTARFTSTLTVTANTWYRLEAMFDTTAQQGRLRIFTGANLHGATADEDSGLLTMNLQAGPMDNVFFGIATNAQDYNVFLDGIAVDDTTWAGPAVSPGSVAGVASTASGICKVPVVSAAATVTAVAAAVSAASLAPTVTGGASVAGVASTGSTSAGTPSASAAAAVEAVATSAATSAQPPVATAAAILEPEAAGANIEAQVPAVDAGAVGEVEAVAGTATAATPAPTLSAAVIIEAVVMPGTVAVSAPALSGAATVEAVAALLAMSATVPLVTTVDPRDITATAVVLGSRYGAMVRRSAYAATVDASGWRARVRP